MSRVLPILFNTEMVRAILDGRKTVTRRVVKYNVEAVLNSPYHKEHPEVSDKTIIKKLCMPPYQPGDILYVRETWCENPNYKEYYYAAKREKGANAPYGLKWRPSIHMPKEAARIWLKVTNVRVERLQDITEEQAQAEGCNSGMLSGPCSARWQFEELWNSTIKKADLDRYGWDASPWVWVIEFERCEKPESGG